MLCVSPSTGEIIIAKANNVLKFAPLKANRTGISGTLFVTNFKVSFVTLLPVEAKVRLDSFQVLDILPLVILHAGLLTLSPLHYLLHSHT